MRSLPKNYLENASSEYPEDGFVPDDSVFLPIQHFDIEYNPNSPIDTAHDGIYVHYKYYDPQEKKIKDAYYSGD